MVVTVLDAFTVTLQMRLPVPPILLQPVQPEKLVEFTDDGAVKTINVPLATVLV